ncbi:hypothetical protein MyNCGM121_11290 [Achromobacter xylosoxidans]
MGEERGMGRRGKGAGGALGAPDVRECLMTVGPGRAGRTESSRPPSGKTVPDSAPTIPDLAENY